MHTFIEMVLILMIPALLSALILALMVRHLKEIRI